MLEEPPKGRALRSWFSQSGGGPRPSCRSRRPVSNLEVVSCDPLPWMAVAWFEVDLELDVAEDVEADLVEERDRLAIARGRLHEHADRSRRLRFLHDPFGQRASDAVAPRLLRDDDRLEL